MSQSPVVQAIKHICEEKNIPMEMVVQTVEAALAAAYRKDFGQLNQNIKVKMNMDDGSFDVFDVKTVVPFRDLEEEERLENEKRLKMEEDVKSLESEGLSHDEAIKKTIRDKADAKAETADEGVGEEEVRRFNPKLEIMIPDAQSIKKDAKLDDVVSTQLDVPEAFGRMAAQTAKQVIIQKLREAERITVFEEFKQKEGEVITGVIQRKEMSVVLVDLGKTIGVLPHDNQVSGDVYQSGQRIKVYVEKVEMGSKGPEITLSRTHPVMVKKLFEFEIPEISTGAIEIISVAREAGSRSKIAVKALQENIDPIGSCVGQRGTRVQTIINEIGGEKIDIIEYNDEPSVYISNALSPAKVLNIEINEKEKSAQVFVAEDQLSLAIGRSGQNVRLAAKLTGWKVNVKPATTGVDEVSDQEDVENEQTDKIPEEQDIKQSVDKNEPEVKNKDAE